MDGVGSYEISCGSGPHLGSLGVWWDPRGPGGGLLRLGGLFCGKREQCSLPCIGGELVQGNVNNIS